MHHKSIRFAALVLSVLISLSGLTSCGGSKTTIRTASDGGIISPDGTAGPRTVSVLTTEKLFSDNGYSFLIDKSSGGIAVTDGKKAWTALPLTENGTASVLTVRVIGRDGTRILDSQSDCAVYGGFSYEVNGNTVNAKYVFSENADAAAKSDDELGKHDLRVTVPVSYTFADSALTVRVDTAGIKLSSGTVVESISLMPYFCAVAPSSDRNNKDFLLVPDGCGALIFTGRTAADYNEKRYAVYGSRDDDVYDAPLGAFGARTGRYAVAAIVTEGEAISEIRAASASAKTSSYHIVYPAFTLTEVKSDGGKLSMSDSYSGPVCVVYRFLSENNANETGMAAAVRAVLILNGTIPDGVKPETTLPLNVELICSPDGKRNNIVSGFEEAEDFLSVLKGKGLNNVKLIMNGCLSGGLVQEPVRKAGLLRAAGGEKDFSSLCGYAKKQGYSVFLAANVTYGADENRPALDMDGNKTEKAADALLTDGKNELVLTKLSLLEKSCVRLMEYAGKLGADGCALTDAGEPPVSDHASGISDRQTASDIVAQNVSSFGTLGKLAVFGGNFNTLASADVITELPFYTSCPESEGYRAIPFIQTVLHASAAYSGAPVNTAALPRLEMLKTVEYGGVPYFRWTLGGNSVCNYENMFSDAVEFCTDASAQLSDLFDKRITGHYQTADGVFCTEYSSGTLVYINYNNYSVDVGNIAVMPYDYIRIN